MDQTHLEKIIYETNDYALFYLLSMKVILSVII